MSSPVGSKALGYLHVWSEGKIIRECDTFTCQHCNQIVPVPPMCRPNDVPGGQCKGCMGLVCTSCYDKGGCTTIEKWCEEQERKGRWSRQYDEVVGQ